jgi:erythromycin esterase-like protein
MLSISRYGALLIFPIVAGTVAATTTYLISAQFTGGIAICLSATLAVFLLIVYALARQRSDSFAPKHPNFLAAAISGLSAAALTIAFAYPSLAELFIRVSESPSEANVESLRPVAIPLKSVDAGTGFVDLEPLRLVLKAARIVALGEATHGTSEFFRAKHRMLEFLVSELGFEHFGMETNDKVGSAINAYIQGGEVKPWSALYWPWATVEVAGMIDWMRAYNLDPKCARQIVFHGIDPGFGTRDRAMAENTSQILAAGGEGSKIVLWAHNGHISNAAGQLGNHLKQEFGDQVYLCGFEFNRGAFTSRMGAIHTYEIGPASRAYYAYALAKLGAPMLFLDFKGMSRNPDLYHWLAKDLSSHDFAELYAIFRLSPSWHTVRVSWLRLYDGLIFIENSTPAIGLKLVHCGSNHDHSMAVQATKPYFFFATNVPLGWNTTASTIWPESLFLNSTLKPDRPLMSKASPFVGTNS